MLQDFIKITCIENFEHSPTSDQNNAFEAFANFVNSEKEVFILKGYAGTGKTSLVSAIIKTLEKFEFQSCLLAPTGRAAKVLANYTKKEASTIHKKIYRQQSVGDGGFQKFAINFNKLSKAFFFVDEASMISNKNSENSMFGSGLLIDDLMEFIFNQRNCKLVIIGDDAQLPPIGVENRPALSSEFFEKTYLKDCEEVTLRNIVRQESQSGILKESTNVRFLIENNKTQFPKLQTHADVESVPGNELIEKIESSHNSVGIEETIIVTRSNKLANRYNEGIRNAILWRESQISTGDYIMIVKNNYYWAENSKAIDFIANGDTAKILKIYGYEDLYGFSFANVRVAFPDYEDEEMDVKVMLNTLHSEAPSLTYDESQKFYSNVLEDYAEIRSKAKKYQEMKKNEYFNALQIKFAYAVTCHKAQGGQWKHVYIDHGYFTEESINIDFLRWLYTAFTRATEKLFLVNFKKNFFE